MIVWRVASAAWAFAIAILMAQDWRRLRALSESERTLVHWQLLVLFWASLILVALLQVANSVHLHALWPLLVALILSLLSAFQQFMLLLYAGFRAA